MNFDLAIWNSDPEITERRAAQIFDKLCKGERPSEVKASANTAAFYKELTEQWPDLVTEFRSLAKTDHSPWSAPILHTDAYILLSCDWSKAEEVYAFARQLANEHDLIFYDPQADEVFLPG